MQKIELFNAIKSEDINHLKKMKESGIILDDVMKSKFGSSYEHILLAKSSPNTLRFLIKWELDSGNWWYPDAVLETAVYDNIPLFASIAIELGASVNGKASYVNHILDIVRFNKVELCKIYIDAGVDLTKIDEYKRGVFHYVKSHEIMDLILPYMLEDHKDEWGKTAYETHIECIPNGIYDKWNDQQLRIELANRIMTHLSSRSKL